MLVELAIPQVESSDSASCIHYHSQAHYCGEKLHILRWGCTAVEGNLSVVVDWLKQLPRRGERDDDG